MKKKKQTTYEAIGETDENIVYKRTRYLKNGIFDDTIEVPKDFNLKKNNEKRN